MKGIKRGGTNSRTEYTVSYSNMGGIDLSATASSARVRYSELKNMYRNYDENPDRLESIPGFRRIATTNGRVNRLFLQKDSDGENHVVVHSKNSLYRFSLNDRDGFTNPSPIATVADTKSSAFSAEGDLFILDGERITVISEKGKAGILGEGIYTPYIPTTYENGIEYQQRNLLTNEFSERYYISSSADFYDANAELAFSVSDDEKRQCAVIGISPDFIGGTLYIPAYTVINGEKYRVTEISDAAFAKDFRLTGVIIHEGLIKIGRAAFKGCINITTLVIPESVVEICDSAFSGCDTISIFYLGAGVRKIGASAFSGCTDLKSVNYSADKQTFSSIEGVGDLSTLSLIEYSRYNTVRVKIPLFTPTESVSLVRLDGTACEFFAHRVNGICDSVILTATGKSYFDRKTVEIFATAHEGEITRSRTKAGLNSILPPTMTAKEAVTGCTVAISFDGRIFLSGNPGIPNTVIYSERDENGINSPYYFGAYNFFNDGLGNFPVIGLLAAGDALAVFKSDDDGCGSIFYHTPAITDSNVVPKIYPVTHTHSGICAIGASISFRDDPVFISRNGLSALSRSSINEERSIYCRSHNVNPLLLTENLSEVSLARWRGYLAIFADARVYLADSRATFKHPSGNIEYEWYFIDGIGTYRQDGRVFRYASTVSQPGYYIHPEKIDTPVYGDEVIDGQAANGSAIYYVEENGKKYEVFPTEELYGGIFYPQTASLSVDDEFLLFGTAAGDVCIFNNDKKGVAPPYILADKNFDYEEFERIYGKKLHPYYYSFDSHAIEHTVKTAPDNCGMPHLEKNTSKNSLSLKCSVGGAGADLLLEVGTDRRGYTEAAHIPSAVIDFSDMDFSRLALCGRGDITLALSEKEKRWIEKQISISQKGFRSPISIGSVSYRFTVKGRIKN